jgi:hypothetical protein
VIRRALVWQIFRPGELGGLQMSLAWARCGLGEILDRSSVAEIGAERGQLGAQLGYFSLEAGEAVLGRLELFGLRRG